jgi:hypothetical protein
MPSQYSEAAASAASSSSSASAAPATKTGDNEGFTTGPAATLDTLTPRDEFVIECLRNARYHEDRERFFAGTHKTAMFVVVVSGTATFAWLKAAPYLAAIITLAGLLDLVFDISGKARLHASLRRQVYEILAQTEDSKRNLESLREQAIRVYADEPPCMHAANYIAFNGAMDAMHRPRAFQYKIEWYHRLLRHVWPFAPTEFKTFSELAKPGA